MSAYVVIISNGQTFVFLIFVRDTNLANSALCVHVVRCHTASYAAGNGRAPIESCFLPDGSPLAAEMLDSCRKARQLAEQSVASNTIGPRFESSHRQNFILNICLLVTTAGGPQFESSHRQKFILNICLLVYYRLY